MHETGWLSSDAFITLSIWRKLLELLRATRLKNRISQDYLAVNLRVLSSSISRWESKGNFPSVDKLFEYAELLGFTLQEVLALSANAQLKPPTSW